MPFWNSDGIDDLVGSKHFTSIHLYNNGLNKRLWAHNCSEHFFFIDWPKHSLPKSFIGNYLAQIIESLPIFKHVEIQQFGWCEQWRWKKSLTHLHTHTHASKIGQHPSNTLHGILLSQTFIPMHTRYISNKSLDSCLSPRYNRSETTKIHSHFVFQITMTMTGIPEKKKGSELKFWWNN